MKGNTWFIPENAKNRRLQEESVKMGRRNSKIHIVKSERYECDGKTVLDLPEELKELGIYLAETRTE